MMNKRIAIKICGLKDPETAYQSALLGADYIGVIFHPDSKRHVSLGQAHDIACAAEEGGAKAVAVFVNQSAADIESVCTKTNLSIAQLHGAQSRNNHNLLPSRFKKIIAFATCKSGYISSQDKEIIKELDRSRDYILFDGPQAGSGKTINTTHLQTMAGSFNYFIAGGLNANNASSIMDTITPYGVDISSGVENHAGEKQINLIASFITSINSISSTKGNSSC